MPCVRPNYIGKGNSDKADAQRGVHSALTAACGRKLVAEAFYSGGARIARNRAIEEQQPKDNEDNGRIAL
ncbi:MAG TPA: hypothetical protein VIB39_10940 [Candidatus Angelobacter sp.]|jgi:hypothetical protein